MTTYIRTLPHKLCVVFFIAILLSGFYACEDTTSSDSDNEDKIGGNGGNGGGDPADLSVFDKWIADNKANNLAETTSGTLISTRGDLEAITAGGEYHLTANLDLGAEDWTPLFSKDEPFTGTLHGNGYIIYNLNISALNKDYQGLFAALSGANIKNLGIGIRSIQANAVAGALAGHAQNGTANLDITNIIVAGIEETVETETMETGSQIIVAGTTSISISETGTASGSYAGAVFGFLSSGDVSMLINEGLAVMATGETSSHGAVGGLVGRNNNSNIRNSKSSGAVTSNSGDDVGGLVGYNGNNSIVHGSASGDVGSNSGNNVGGLVGQNRNGIVHGSASGDVITQSGSTIGGLVGYANGGTVYGSATGDITTISGSTVGGLVGGNYGVVHGSASGTVRALSGDNVGGFMGRNSYGGGIEGYSIGWVIVAQDNTNTNIGAAVGLSINLVTTNPSPIALDKVYHYLDKSTDATTNITTIHDHVGSTGIVENDINTGDADDSGTRGTNGIGTGVDTIDSSMSGLTLGTAVGQWTRTAGEWPKVNLPEGITDYMDYTTSPAQPVGFID